MEQLLPLFLSLLKDDWPDVRLAIIGKLQAVNQASSNHSAWKQLQPVALPMQHMSQRHLLTNWSRVLAQVIGIELLAQTLLPAVEDLATDKHWRVRQAIIEHTPMLATQVWACSLHFGWDYSRQP